MRLSALSLTLALTAAVAPARAADLDAAGARAVLTRLQQTAKGYETLQFTIAQEVAAMGQSIQATGRVQAAGERMAMTMTMHMPTGRRAGH